MPLASLFIVGFVMSSALGRGWSAFIFVGGLLAYLLVSYASPSSRHYPLAFLVGIHVGAVLTYYTRPVPLPFLIVELSPFGPTLNIDIVQVLVAYELVTRYLSKRSQSISPAPQMVGGGQSPVAEGQGTNADRGGEGAPEPREEERGAERL